MYNSTCCKRLKFAVSLANRYEASRALVTPYARKLTFLKKFSMTLLLHLRLKLIQCLRNVYKHSIYVITSQMLAESDSKSNIINIFLVHLRRIITRTRDSPGELVSGVVQLVVGEPGGVGGVTEGGGCWVGKGGALEKPRRHHPLQGQRAAGAMQGHILRGKGREEEKVTVFLPSNVFLPS